MPLERILRIADADLSARFLRNNKSGKVALQVRARSLMEEIEGTPTERVELMRPTRNEYHRATADGRSWLGRLVFEEHLPDLCTKLGSASASDLPASPIVQAANAGHSVDIARPFAVTVKRALVNDNYRIELSGCPSDRLPWLKSLGAFTGIIRYRTRVFLPVAMAETILEQFLQTR